MRKKNGCVLVVHEGNKKTIGKMEFLVYHVVHIYCDGYMDPATPDIEAALAMTTLSTPPQGPKCEPKKPPLCPSNLHTYEGTLYFLASLIIRYIHI